MNEYTPDRWCVVELIDGTQKYRKIFSGNYGGYGGSDTWKLSSAIESETPDEHGWHFNCASGSIYHCNKHSFGMSGYMANIYQSWKNMESDYFKLKILEDEYDRRV